MGVKLSNIAANSAVVKVPAGDEEVTVEYYPGRITDDMFLMVTTLQDQGAELTNEVNSTLATLVKSWDLVEDDGVTPIPLTEDGLRRVYFPFKMRILNAVMSDISPEAAALAG